MGADSALGNPFGKKSKKLPTVKEAAAQAGEAMIGKGADRRIHAGEFENAIQAADSLLAAPFGPERDEVRAAVDAWIGSDSERARAVTLEYYSKCDKRGVPRR